MQQSNTHKLIAVGFAGSVIAALCCFTPLLVIVLGAAGLSGVLVWTDYVLLPALAFFVALTGYAVWRRLR